MKGSVKYTLTAIGFVAVLVLAAAAYRILSPRFAAPQPEAPAAAAEPLAAQDFTVQEKDGAEVSLSDKLGKPVVVNFWASWCAPCVSELADFNEAAAAYDGRVDFMMVNLTDGERNTVASASRYVEKNGYTFPVYYDVGLSASNAYGIHSIPTTLFIDAEGRLVDTYVGAMPEQVLRRYLEELTGQTEAVSSK